MQIAVPDESTNRKAYSLSEASTFCQDLESLRQTWQQHPAYRGLDLETTGLDPWSAKVITIALGEPGMVRILDMRAYYRLPVAQQTEWRQTLCHLLHMPGITWVGHNLKFDWEFLKVHFDVALSQVYDTMIAEQVIQGTGLNKAKVSVSLLESARRYGITVTKEERSWFIDLESRPDAWNGSLPEQQQAYIAQDISVPCQMREHQQDILNQYQLQSVLALEYEALPAIAAMEVRGALIDQAHWQHVLTVKRGRQEFLEHALQEELGNALSSSQCEKREAQQKALVDWQSARAIENKRLMNEYLTSSVRGQQSWQSFYHGQLDDWKSRHPEPTKFKAPQGTINLGSSDQVIAALNHLGIMVTSTREEVLEEYAERYTLIGRLLAWRKLQHFRTAFGQNILSYIKEDGRIHANFAQVGAVSGRIICNSPNLQQIPKKQAKEPDEEDVRRCFIAPAGYQLLKADLSNIELRILAEMANDATMLRFFAEGKDLHAETAKLMFNLPAQTNTKEHLYKDVPVRDIAKTINFGLAYGMGAQGLANRTGVSVQDAKGLIKRYFSTYMGVDRWLRQAAHDAMRKGFASTLAGRKRFFQVQGLTPSQRAGAERTAKNHPIQGTNADILKRALTLLHQELPSGAHIVLSVHDEIVLEVPDALCEAAAIILQDCMLRACKNYLHTVHIPEPDVLIAPYWKKD